MSLFSVTGQGPKRHCRPTSSGGSPRSVLPFQAQASTCSGIADFTLSYQQGLRDPWCILEVKRGLHPRKTSVSDLAGHFWRCVKYQRSTGLPVFLGRSSSRPWEIDLLFWRRGIAAFIDCSIFSAGRARQRGPVLHSVRKRAGNHPSLWGGFILTMRNKPVASYHVGGQNTLWPNGSVDLVSFDKAPSASVRVAS